MTIISVLTIFTWQAVCIFFHKTARGSVEECCLKFWLRFKSTRIMTLLSALEVRRVLLEGGGVTYFSI